MKIVKAKQLNVNDEYILVNEWYKNEGDLVKQSELVGSIETTKASIDLESEGDGYFYPVAKPGDQVEIGSILYVITKKRESNIQELVKREMKMGPKIELEESKKWTKKAELLAKKSKINIENIPAVGVIQEADVKRYLKNRIGIEAVNDFIDDIYRVNRAEKVLVIGGGRGAVQTLNVLWNSSNQRPVGIVDDNEKLVNKKVMGVEVVGTLDLIPKLFEDPFFDTLIISFSNDIDARKEIFEKYQELGINFTNVIDESVCIHSNIEIGTGNLVMANSRLGSCAKIGNNNFLSAFVNIEHHNVLGSHCTFGPAVFTSSRVNIGDKVRFGTGIFIEPGINIGSNSIVASGAVLTSDVDSNSIVKTKVATIMRKREN